MRCLKLLSFSIAIMLTGCINLSQPKIEYIKITPQKAEAMMTDEVIILDVRRQDEFDDGHIKNAILLPEYEVREKIESIAIDKNQTILVYCGEGMRSENISKDLIKMGYTRVFDFGGIVNWTGEIVWDITDEIYYNYFGGELPPSLISPINYNVSKKINSQIPEFNFYINGNDIRDYYLQHDMNRYYLSYSNTVIESIIIKDNNNVIIQEISGLETATPACEENQYGFSFDDWNFDGFFDISLWKFQGGSMHNNPTYYWLWDNSLGKYIENKELEERSDWCSLSTDEELQQVVGYTSAGAFGNVHCFYEYSNGRFILVKSIEEIFEQSYDDKDKYTSHTIIEELIDGDMKITNK